MDFDFYPAFYVYKTTDEDTGNMYIGMRGATSYAINKNYEDGYLGSGVWIRAAKKAKRKLSREIIKIFNGENRYENYENARDLEKAIINGSKGSPKLMNIAGARWSRATMAFVNYKDWNKKLISNTAAV